MSNCTLSTPARQSKSDLLRGPASARPNRPVAAIPGESPPPPLSEIWRCDGIYVITFAHADFSAARNS